jgi:hypothetical protein
MYISRGDTENVDARVSMMGIYYRVVYILLVYTYILENQKFFCIYRSIYIRTPSAAIYAIARASAASSGFGISDR